MLREGFELRHALTQPLEESMHRRDAEHQQRDPQLKSESAQDQAQIDPPPVIGTENGDPEDQRDADETVEAGHG